MIAQLGKPDMRTPIAHAMAYPERINSGVLPLDFTQLLTLTFEAPDFVRYPNLKLAIEAFSQGQAATTTLNAANEVAVDAFFAGAGWGFMDIATVNAAILALNTHSEPNNIEEIIAIDQWARETTSTFIHRHN